MVADIRFPPAADSIPSFDVLLLLRLQLLELRQLR